MSSYVAGTTVYGSTSVAPSYPTGAVAGDLFVLLVGIKPGTSTAATPSGWTAAGSVASTTGTTGTDTGPMRAQAFTKTAAGGESGSVSVSIASGNSSAGQIVRVTPSIAGASLGAAYATGADGSAGAAWSATLGSVALAAGDLCLGLGVIPTDVTTPAQFSGEGFAASGITFGAAAEIVEWDTTTGNDMGGFVFAQSVTAGSGTVAPTMTATHWSFTFTRIT